MSATLSPPPHDMFKFLRVPERLFSIAMWAVSLVFASFLTGLGGKIVGELPGVDQSLSLDQFVSPALLQPIRVRRNGLQEEARSVNDRRNTAQLVFDSTASSYDTRKAAYDTWISTRTATSDPRQDPEVLTRTAELESLGTRQREAKRTLESLDARRLQVDQAVDSLAMAEERLLDAARPQYAAAQFRQEMRVFGIRLALTLPLLLIGIWLLARKRKSQYWPLARGFVLFALIAFFVELVPYLPSYGGYVRYVVGIVLTLVAGHYVIRAMQRYLAKRQVVEQQTETERRQSLGYEEALKKMGANMCPGCERAIAGGPNATTNFCVHCGMKLFDTCGSCDTRKNAFFQYCPSCGVNAVPPVAPASSAAPGTA
ncbi:MAG: zinc ribbon domain-containing protein [Gemmatimonadaceae bacterium]|nr:zinc ribbon domain-containing protein [Gemmatimonadaceae bacterium]